MWFETLAGFRESDVSNVAAQFAVEGDHIRSLANGRRMQHGRFATPTLGELRQRWAGLAKSSGAIRVRGIVGDAQALHRVPTNAGACFQVASQFNTLEMDSPRVTPEHGIDRYENDHTQGPRAPSRVVRGRSTATTSCR